MCQVYYYQGLYRRLELRNDVFGIYILDTPDGKTGSLLTELCGGRWSVGATDGTPLTGLKAYAAERCYTVEPRRWFRLSPT